ncbi:lipase family protein [Prescottella subtropica]|uniref:lipase family protein n=1 Tax=Prescottella subtropica TaxID=2545757 RepID=UPI0010F9D432|nr:hypothetical protein [Prescottella subtropica]
MDAAVAVECGNLVQAAYAGYATDQTVPDPDTVALPEGYTLVRTIQMRDLAGLGPVLFGFLAVGGSPRTQVIALRGTATPAEWVDDLHWTPVAFPQAGTGGHVADGFLGLYDTLTSAEPGKPGTPAGTAGLAAAVDPALPLVVTGHSLGGALATLLAADLAANTPLTPQVWTFASPKVGDAAFAARFGQLCPVSWRIHNIVDVVPYFPVDPADAYRDVATGYPVDSLPVARWSLGCAHALNTYLTCLAPETVPIAANCRRG